MYEVVFSSRIEVLSRLIEMGKMKRGLVFANTKRVVDVDEIYNLACPASPIHYQYDPIKTIKTSFLGALHMLGIAKRCNAKIMQASTSEVYGDPEVHPQVESYWGNVNPVGYRSCYDEGKRWLRPSSWITIVNTDCVSRLSASSTPTDPTCCPTMAA